MADVFDIKLGEDQDLLIENGDFVVAESTIQHQFLLLKSDKGQFKQYPTIGVGIDSYLNDEQSPADIKRVIQTEFEYDGMKIKKMSISDLSKATIVGEYVAQDSTNTR